ncbi:8115_t:CDS:2 [Racocetra fulgida]|uniref:8115_t:CDS:1 n=1 Tax=Racocetra fulgida TaxID=60492 RepID=A0A9N9GW27_9GLOM|nr:8115_t:CDS:2 [Racocetra fulgida]
MVIIVTSVLVSLKYGVEGREIGKDVKHDESEGLGEDGREDGGEEKEDVKCDDFGANRGEFGGD